MNPIDHPHGGEKVKHQGGETPCLHGEHRPKVIKLDQIRELIS